MASEAADWIELQNRFYQVQDVYRMQWEGANLHDHLVACAPFGGPIATVRDPSKLIQVGLASSLSQLQTTVSIYSAAGLLLASFPWSSQGAPLVDLGWTSDLTLVLCAQDGSIVQYTLQGQHIPGTISLDNGLNPIVKVAFFNGCGVASISEDLQLFIVPDLKDPEVVSFSLPELAEVPTSLLPLAPACVPLKPAPEPPPPPSTPAGDTVSVSALQSERPEASCPPILLATSSSLIVFTPDDGQSTELSLPGVEHMALSPSGKLLGCFSMDGILHVIVCRNSFEVVAQFDTKMCQAPDKLAWCGEDAVLAHWEESGSLLLVGPEDSSAIPGYEDMPGIPLVLSPEVDGARVITLKTSAFVQRVPDPVISIFGIGSTEPGALLFDAFDQFEKRSIKADDSIRLLGDSMVQAVEACAEAACHSPSTATQKALLSATAYGRAFVRTPMERDLIRSACMVLRVLNSIHDPEMAGIPLTFGQFQALGPATVVSLLLAHHRHLLALRVSQYLNLPESKVLEHWAVAKISTSSFLSDDDLYQTLMAKLKQEKGTQISFASIAEVAHAKNRLRLAARLLDHEVNEQRVVKLLVRMKQFAVAMRKAETCADSDLLYLVIFQVQKSLPEESLFQLLEAYPVARNLFIAHCKQTNRELLRRFFSAWNKPHLVAELLLEDSLHAVSAGAANSHESGGPWSPQVLKEIETSAGLFDATKEHPFEGSSIHELVKLVKLQQKGESGMLASTRALLQGKNVSDSIYTCVSHSTSVTAQTASDQQQHILLNQMAQRIRSDMRVPDRRFYWLKLRALSSLQDWAALEKFSKERRPPIGYRPFADACIEAGALDEAAKYISRVPDAQEREELYKRIGTQPPGGQGGSSGDLLGSLASSAASTAASALFRGWGFS